MLAGSILRLGITGLLGLYSLVGEQTNRVPGDVSHNKLPRLKVSDNGRFLVTEAGTPFFWLGDTAWWIRRIPPADVDRYLSNRARHRFNVILVHCGLEEADYAKNTPFVDKNPSTPNEPFWRNIDSIVLKAQDQGLYVALVPLWGHEYRKAFGKDALKAQQFTNWIGERYGGFTNVLWIVSGEYESIAEYARTITEEQKDIFIAAANGLRSAHEGRQLMTIHPGWFTSSKDFHQQSWLDFNILQSGHFIDAAAYKAPDNDELISRDYALSPTKPVLEGEPIYEDTPDAVWKVKHVEGPRAGADTMRRKAYRAVFSGAFGHTYGHNDLYGFFEPKHPGHMQTLKTQPRGPGQRGNWWTALDAPGGSQMKHLRALFESRPFLTRTPDAALAIEGSDRGVNRLTGTRDALGTYGMVYVPYGERFRVRLEKISGLEINAWWFDPRNGKAELIGSYKAKGERDFQPPSAEDWVLVLDDASLSYPAPGARP
jgi:hypothetical protein